VGQHDRAMIGMFLHNLPRPDQHFITWSEFERDDHEFHARAFELVPGIVMALVEGATEFFRLRVFRAREVLVEVGLPIFRRFVGKFALVRFAKAHVVISKAQTIRHFAIQLGHRLLRNLPFFRIVRLHDVALVDEEFNIQPVTIVPRPLRLFDEVTPQIPVLPMVRRLFHPRIAIALGVRQYDDGKGLRRTQLGGGNRDQKNAGPCSEVDH
jgi:hypothetical protein